MEAEPHLAAAAQRVGAALGRGEEGPAHRRVPATDRPRGKGHTGHPTSTGAADGLSLSHPGCSSCLSVHYLSQTEGHCPPDNKSKTQESAPRSSENTSHSDLCHSFRKHLQRLASDPCRPLFLHHLPPIRVPSSDGLCAGAGGGLSARSDTLPGTCHPHPSLKTETTRVPLKVQPALQGIFSYTHRGTWEASLFPQTSEMWSVGEVSTATLEPLECHRLLECHLPSVPASSSVMIHGEKVIPQDKTGV